MYRYFSSILLNAQRRYGESSSEIGVGDLKDYFTDMLACTAEMWRILHPTGLLWLNMGDTAAGSGGAGGDYSSGRKAGRPKFKQGEVDLPGRQWLQVPTRLAYYMQKQGWLLRSTIIWNKLAVRPEDIRHVRRPLLQYEFIFMFAKQKDYFFKPLPQGKFDQGNVWTFPSVSGKLGKGHQAPFPRQLPLRCILHSTNKGHLVVDPFAGSGTTVNVAKQLKREGRGFDLYGG